MVRSVGRLYPLLRRESSLGTNNNVQIIKSVINPQILYGCELWDDKDSSITMKMESFNNKTLRIEVNPYRKRANY